MKLTFLLITLFIVSSNIDAHKNTETVLINEVDYKDGIYYFNDKIFNGDIIDYFEDETLKFRYGVLDGRLNGQAKEFYANGSVKSERTYYMSKLYGAFTEYFLDGKIKAKFDVKLNAYGKGEIVENIVIGTVKKGKLKIREYEKGIIYFLGDNGDFFESSEHISILNQTHYKIMDEEDGDLLIMVK